MIASARETYPEQEWVLAGIEDWSAPVPYDIVFSNAALQWVGDHVSLTAHLLAQVAPGGALAFQIPSAEYSRVRGLMDEVARDSAWAARMAGPRTMLTMEEPGVYYDALAPAATSIDLWETTYHHVLGSPSAIVEWISSTGLRPFLDALDTEGEKQLFLERFSELVVEAYARQADGRVLFPFRRTFVIAYA
jgi:trans-aconitate 2-methyltransferase